MDNTPFLSCISRVPSASLFVSFRAPLLLLKQSQLDAARDNDNTAGFAKCASKVQKLEKLLFLRQRFEPKMTLMGVTPCEVPRRADFQDALS